MYTFTAMEPECTSLHDTFGTVELSGHNSLIGEAMKEDIPPCYWATPWKKVDGNKLHLKVAIVYYIQFWLKVSIAQVCDLCCALTLLLIVHVMVNAPVIGSF